MYAIDGFSGHWGQWMFSIGWQLALLIVVLTGLTLLLRKKSAVFLHALWLLVLIRLVLPPAFAFPTGWAWWLRDGTSRPVAQLPAESGPSRQSAVNGDNQVVAHPTVEAAAPDSEASHPPLEQSTPQSSQPKQATGSSSSNVDLQSLLMLSWAGVTLTMIGMLVRGQILTWQWIRKAKANDDPRLFDIMSRCCRRLGVKRHIALRDSESCSTPLVVGLFRPLVLLPSSVPQQLSDQELEAVLTHELAHVARHDALINLFQGVLGAIYFFNPLVWFANYQINRLREEACDELTVTALNGRRKAYGSAIIKVTEILGYAPSPLALGIMEVKHSAKRRISRILDPDLPRGHGLKWSSLIFVALIGAILLPSGAKPSAASIAATIAFLSGSNSNDADNSSEDQNPADDSPAEKSKSTGNATKQSVQVDAREASKKSAVKKSAAKKLATDKTNKRAAKKTSKGSATSSKKSKRPPRPAKRQPLSAPWRYEWASKSVLIRRDDSGRGRQTNRHPSRHSDNLRDSSVFGSNLHSISTSLSRLKQNQKDEPLWLAHNQI